MRLLLVSTAAVQTGSLVAMCAHLAKPSPGKPAPALQASAPQPAEFWALAAFEGLRGTCFLVAGQELLLDQVEGHARGGVDTVSLRFSGPASRPLEGQLHRFTHPARPALDLFVVPGSAASGSQLYRVTICRLAPKPSNLLSPPEALSLPAWATGPGATPV